MTHHLYGGDDAYRLKQESVLGIGGAGSCARSASRSPPIT